MCVALQEFSLSLPPHPPTPRHPDKNSSPRAQEKIMQINRAYEVRGESVEACSNARGCLAFSVCRTTPPDPVGLGKATSL